jgi:hypothetical protein
MSVKLYRVSELSRHTFEKLVALWITIICATLALAFLVSASSAHAEVFPFLPKAEQVYKPAVFTNFSPPPASSQVKEQCQPHLLHPHQTGQALTKPSSEAQRNAEKRKAYIMASIKAYRDCVSRITLEKFASRY